MKLLLIGGIGNLGMALLKNFRDKNDTKIYVMDDSSRMSQKIRELLAQDKIDFIDSASTEINSKLLDLLGIDVVIHLAFRSVATVESTLASQNFNPNLTFATKVSQACLEAQIPLIYTSSTSVYHNLTGSVTEESEIHGFNSSYAKSKMQIEQYLKSVPELKLLILRLGSVHGISDGMKFETVVNKFCMQYFYKSPLTVWDGALGVIRPYLSLKDFTYAIEFLINAEGFKNQLYNVVTKSWSTHDLISTLERVGGRRPSIQFETKVDFSRKSILVSTSKFTETGFEFTGSLERDIEDTLNFLKTI